MLWAVDLPLRFSTTNLTSFVFLEKGTHHEEVKFITGMQRWLNVHKSIYAIPHNNRIKD